MVQMPCGVEARVAGSFAGSVSVGAVRTAAEAGARVVAVSRRRADVVFDVAFTAAGPVADALGELGGGDDVMVGEPDDRTLGETGAAVAAADVGGVDGQRAPW
jgi:hypothetical protein